MNDPVRIALQVAMSILSEKAILLIGMVLDFLLFVWSMRAPSILTLIPPVSFGVLVLCIYGLGIWKK